MSRIHSVMIPLFLLVAAACEKVDHGPETGGPDPIEAPTLWLWPGQDTLLRTEDDPAAYTFSSGNEEVAAVELNQGGLTIKAGRPGVTWIRIDGGPNGSITLEVRSSMIAGDWESIPDDATYKNQLQVEAEDAVFAEELKRQLQEETARLLGFRFSPYIDASTGELDSAIFVKLISGTPPRIIQRGSYSLADLALTLSLPDDGKEEVFHLLPYADRTVLGLQQDLTKRYQELHPDKGIRKVSVTLHLQFLPPPG